MYAGPITVLTAVTITAVAQGEFGLSDPASELVTVFRLAPEPTISPSSGSQPLNSHVTITINHPDLSGHVYYRVCGGSSCASPLDDLTAALRYQAPFELTVSGTITVTAVSTGDGGGVLLRPSQVVSVTYTVKSQCPAPVIVTPGKRYPTSVSVLITQETCTTHYRVTNDTTQTEYSMYKEAVFDVEGKYLVEAFGRKSGLLDSATVSRAFAVVPAVVMMSAEIVLAASETLPQRTETFRQNIATALSIPLTRVIIDGNEAASDNNIILSFHIALIEDPLLSLSSNETSAAVSQSLLALPSNSLAASGISNLKANGAAAETPVDDDDDDDVAVRVGIIVACVLGGLILLVLVYVGVKRAGLLGQKGSAFDTAASNEKDVMHDAFEDFEMSSEDFRIASASEPFLLSDTHGTPPPPPPPRQFNRIASSQPWDQSTGYVGSVKSQPSRFRAPPSSNVSGPVTRQQI